VWLFKKNPYLIFRLIHYMAEADGISALIDPDALRPPQ